MNTQEKLRLRRLKEEERLLRRRKQISENVNEESEVQPNYDKAYDEEDYMEEIELNRNRFIETNKPKKHKKKKQQEDEEYKGPGAVSTIFAFIGISMIVYFTYKIINELGELFALIPAKEVTTTASNITLDETVYSIVNTIGPNSITVIVLVFVFITIFNSFITRGD